MLLIEQLSKHYTMDKQTPAVVALDNISLQLPQQGLVMIVGTSGCGKTTLLNILGGIDKPTSGTISVDGEAIDYSNNGALDEYRCNTVSFVFQDYNLMYDYTVLDNVRLGMQLQGKSKAEADQKAEEALKAVGLYDMKDRKIGTLSGGQQQRIAIARAIAKDSKFVLCDEPTGNLDSANSDDIFQLLKTLSQQRLFVVVTHNAQAAEQYADRILRLSDGKVAEDKVVKETNLQHQKTDKVDEHTEQTSVSTAKQHKRAKSARGLSFRNMMLMIKDNILNSLLSNITMLVALLVTFTLVTSFLSMSAYNSNSAYVNTLRANNQYVMPLLKYIDKRVETPVESGDDNNSQGTYNDASVNNDGDVIVSYGPQAYYEDAKYEDIAKLQQEMNKVNYYASYFFNKNLQDFTNKFIYTDSKQYQYTAYGFREAVAVEDFSTFHMPLSAGKLPVNSNEVLIYDYMAYSMIELGMFDGKIEDVVGKVLTDVNTGFNMAISGLVESDYQRYSYVTDGLSDYTFEQCYLSGLQAIFCYPSLITKLVEERTYTPVMHADIITYDANGQATDTERLNSVKQLNYIDASGLTFVAKNENFDNMRGVVMSVAQVAEILKIDVADVTQQVAQQFMQDRTVSVLVSLYDYSLERSYAYLDGYQVIGICNEEVSTDGVIALSTHSEDDLSKSNGTFRQIYLSLTDNWADSAQAIEYFAIIYQTQEYYEANPDYYLEAYTTNSPYALMIDDADVYMVKVKNFSSYIMYILIVLTVAFIVIYTHINLKKFDYKIGVLKALGANTWNIILVFGLQLLAISVIGYLLSIPLAALVMSRINVSFVGNASASLVLFALDGTSVAITLAIATIGVAIVTLLPLLKLAFASPISVIRGSRDNQ